jgi:hypothetical protein
MRYDQSCNLNEITELSIGETEEVAGGLVFVPIVAAGLFIEGFKVGVLVGALLIATAAEAH